MLKILFETPYVYTILCSLFQSHSCTMETHAAHCASLDGPLHDHFAITYGIVRDSCLNMSKYFHVTEGLVPDAICMMFLKDASLMK